MSGWRYWYGVVLLFVAAVAGYAGIWLTVPAGCIGLYFLVSGYREDSRRG